MKKTSIILAALIGCAGINAQEAKSSYSVTTDFTYASEYIFRGTELAGSSFQPSIEVTSGNAYVGLWANTPIGNYEELSNEVDFYAGYKHQVSKALTLEAITTYYWYPEARGLNRDFNAGITKYSYEAGLGATYTLSGINLGANYYYDFRLKADTVQASVGYSVPLEAAGASVDFSLYAGSVDLRDASPDYAGPATRESYTYAGADVSLVYKLSEKATVNVGVHYADNDNLAGVGGRNGVWSDNNLWFTTGLAIGF